MEGINIKRLVETACYFNKVSVRKYYSTTTRLNVVDTRAVVCNILINEYKLTKEETSELLICSIIKTLSIEIEILFNNSCWLVTCPKDSTNKAVS